MAYALGANTVICDTLDDARTLCFRRNEKVGRCLSAPLSVVGDCLKEEGGAGGALAPACLPLAFSAGPLKHTHTPTHTTPRTRTRANTQVKAVTMTGAVIAKDGTMTGGRVGASDGGGGLDKRGGGGTIGRYV